MHEKCDDFPRKRETTRGHAESSADSFECHFHKSSLHHFRVLFITQPANPVGTNKVNFKKSETLPYTPSLKMSLSTNFNDGNILLYLICNKPPLFNLLLTML